MSRSLRHGLWHLLFLLILASVNHALSTPSFSTNEHVRAVLWKYESEQDQATNAASIYGIGYRVGSYLRGFTFIIGLIRLEGIIPTTHFAGIILALDSLIRWWMRFNSNGITIGELWAGLAQILIFTTPGTILLFLRSSTVQVLVIVLITNGIDFAFAFEKCGFAGFNHYHSSRTDLDHPVWLGWRLWPSGSKAVIAFVSVQAGLTILLELFPSFIYLHAWWLYATEWLAIRRGSLPPPKPYTTHNPSIFRLWAQHLWEWLHARVVHPVWIGALNVLLLAYQVVLIMSVELTIQQTGLETHNELLDMSQVLPFLTGLISMIAALGTLAQKFSLTVSPVRIERLAPPNENQGALRYVYAGDYCHDGLPVELRYGMPGVN